MIDRVRAFADALQRRLLTFSAPAGYVLTALFAAAPVVVAVAIGGLRSVSVESDSPLAACAPAIVTGYGRAFTFLSLIIVLPVVLWTTRVVSRSLFGVGPGANASTPASARDVPAADRAAIVKALRTAALDGRIVLAALVLGEIINFLDMREALGVYWHPGSVACPGPSEINWTVMFLLSDRISRTQNLWLLIAAYTVQYAAITLALLVVGLLVRRAVFSLSRVREARGHQ